MKIGDKVRFLSEVGGGIVSGFQNKDTALVRDEDVQVLHGFDSPEHAAAYLKSQLFNDDVVKGLQPLWSADPEVRIYTVA